MNKEFTVRAKKLIDFIGDATCSFTTVVACKEYLKEAGFVELTLKEDWKIKAGGKYFVNVYDSTLAAFTVGKDSDGMLRIVTAHTDSPSFSIKPNAEVKSSLGNFGKLNVEAYGGAILNSWLDRPLSVALRVSLASDNAMEPTVKIVDFKKPIVTIPNLAIHMNRDVNRGVELNKQVDMLPIGLLVNDKVNKDFFMEYISKKLKVAKEDILDFEGYVYNTDKGQLVGINEDFILCPRLDNETSVLACLYGITEAKVESGVNFICVFDNEEIGSMTKQGANSSILTYMLEKIYASLNPKLDGAMFRSKYINTVLNGMMISLDVAHAAHPNHPEKSDITNVIELNKGPVLKRSGVQRYATDAKAIGVCEQLFRKYDIPYQKFANRSDVVGGSTLGPISDVQLPMPTVDIGAPLLAMHSANETMGVKDQYYIEEFVKAFLGEAR